MFDFTTFKNNVKFEFKKLCLKILANILYIVEQNFLFGFYFLFSHIVLFYKNLVGRSKGNHAVKKKKRIIETNITNLFTCYYEKYFYFGENIKQIVCTITLYIVPRMFSTIHGIYFHTVAGTALLVLSNFVVFLTYLPNHFNMTLYRKKKCFAF